MAGRGGQRRDLIYLTAGELEALSQEVLALLLPRFRERLTDPARRPPGAVPVEILMLAYPISLPPPGDVPPDEVAGDGRRAANRPNECRLPGGGPEPSPT